MNGVVYVEELIIMASYDTILSWCSLWRSLRLAIKLLLVKSSTLMKVERRSHEAFNLTRVVGSRWIFAIKENIAP